MRDARRRDVTVVMELRIIHFLNPTDLPLLSYYTVNVAVVVETL